MGMILATLLFSILGIPADDLPGYRDTPVIPGQKWRVHDADRPRPRVVDPGKHEPLARPAEAKVLLGEDGQLGAWAQGGKEIRWKWLGEALQVQPGTGDIFSREAFGDMHLHLEFRTPEKVASSSQGRGNSGVFLMGAFEVQILDSYQNPSYADGQCGALYGQCPPRVNASRGPGEWQSYDIFFTRPRYKGDAVIEPARVTVLHNGVLIHNQQSFMGPTRHLRVSDYQGFRAKEGPIKIQDHGNLMQFRNIWIVDLEPEMGG
ncbi:hypothetical protein CBD41_02045 [bacterium TMED181]|nr:hypothetical protein [Planctomycetota bacterium]OUW46832.1 MAG: hypothetical protein CBD41_02045 [bacterium TMED181]